MSILKKILVAGGAGFIGSHFVRRQLDSNKWGEVRVLDLLTYAGNLENLSDCQDRESFTFFQGDIRDQVALDEILTDVDVVVNFAAESHVDRSIADGDSFVTTNILGAFRLLETSRRTGVQKFIQVSTDEVYGSIESGSWNEKCPLLPNSPYAAAKASADLMLQSVYKTFNFDVRITRCSNNFGTHQHPEKMIPRSITNLLQGRQIDIYGDGSNSRDWLSVIDHCRGIEAALENGKAGEIYNIGGGIELTNNQLVQKILDRMGKSWADVRYIEDRKGHDQRYSVNFEKLVSNCGYEPAMNFDNYLNDTIDWYIDNRQWWFPLVNS